MKEDCLKQCQNLIKKMSKKTEVTVKSNGLRNELKEIRKSIDKLTNAIIAQTNAHE